MNKDHMKLLIEYTDFMEWLHDDDGCDKKDKLPRWAKSHIKDKIDELNVAFQEKAE